MKRLVWIFDLLNCLALLWAGGQIFIATKISNTIIVAQKRNITLEKADYLIKWNGSVQIKTLEACGNLPIPFHVSIQNCHIAPSYVRILTDFEPWSIEHLTWESARFSVINNRVLKKQPAKSEIPLNIHTLDENKENKTPIVQLAAQALKQYLPKFFKQPNNMLLKNTEFIYESNGKFLDVQWQTLLTTADISQATAHFQQLNVQFAHTAISSYKENWTFDEAFIPIHFNKNEISIGKQGSAFLQTSAQLTFYPELVVQNNLSNWHFLLTFPTVNQAQLQYLCPNDLFWKQSLPNNLLVSGALSFSYDINKPENTRANYNIATNQKHIFTSPFIKKQPVFIDSLQAFAKFENQTLNKLPVYFVPSLLASEDPNFYHHKGISKSMFKEAVKTVLSTGSFSRGGSTLTMQWVKNTYLNQKKNLRRKAEQLLFASLIEQLLLNTKTEILENYVNTAQFGTSVFGIKEAASFYFSKTPTQLSLGESLFLVSVLPAPAKAMHLFDDYGNLKPEHVEVLETLKFILYENDSIDDCMFEEAIIEKIKLNSPLANG